MSRLREDAKEALRNKRAEEAATAAAIAESTAVAGVKRACNSPLGRWFPQVEWEFVANLTDGTTVVREKGGIDVLLGVKGPDEWEVAVYAREVSPFVGMTGGQSYRRIEQLKTSAALGEYLERTTPQHAPEDVSA